jgi:phage terminase Nu1 subunit (DNA packaging protein)
MYLGWNPNRHGWNLSRRFGGGKKYFTFLQINIVAFAILSQIGRVIKTVPIRVPEDIHRRVKQVVARDGGSLKKFTDEALSRLADIRDQQFKESKKKIVCA